MIDPALLTRLRKADSGGHDAWKIMHDVYSIREGSAMSDAWLQHVLQEACRTKGWWLDQSTFTANPTAKLQKPSDPIWKDYIRCGDSPTEALLRCYLAAIEA